MPRWAGLPHQPLALLPLPLRTSCYPKGQFFLRPGNRDNASAETNSQQPQPNNQRSSQYSNDNSSNPANGRTGVITREDGEEEQPGNWVHLM